MMGQQEQGQGVHRRVLILTYYWPPSGGSGVQRWLKFAKYLPQQGWTPVVFAPAHADYPLLDETLAKEIPAEVEQIRVPIWEPYAAYRRLTGAKPGVVPDSSAAEGGQGLLKRLATYVRANFFIPDPRKFWVKPLVAAVEAYLDQHEVAAVITTGPPHSVHLAGLQLKQQHPQLPWLMDLRDPWSQLDVHLAFRPGRRARRRILELERQCLSAADRVLATSPSMPTHLEPFDQQKFVCITNGYDPADFERLPHSTNSTEPLDEDLVGDTASGSWRICHIGLLTASRNPTALWQALADCCGSDSGFAERLHIHLIGKVETAVTDSLASHVHLQGKWQVTPWLDHHELPHYYARASVLLLCPNRSDNARGQINGKLFEYLAARRPILHIGPFDADNTRILDATHAGITIPPDDLIAATEAIRLLSSGDFNTNSHAFREEEIQRYDRRQTAAQLAHVLDEVAQLSSVSRRGAAV